MSKNLTPDLANQSSPVAERVTRIAELIRTQVIIVERREPAACEIEQKCQEPLHGTYLPMVLRFAAPGDRTQQQISGS
jgi:hypothetical protein